MRYSGGCLKPAIFLVSVRLNENKYDKDMYDERRRNGELAAAREIGMKEGMEKGVVSVARQMKQMGLPADTIAEATGLSFKDIESL